jgi:hypothetical protein
LLTTFVREYRTMSSMIPLGWFLTWVGLDTMMFATGIWANLQSWKIGLIVGLALVLQGIIALVVGISYEVDR